MIMPYWGWPYFWGGVGVQPMLSDDCPTVEQQIMVLNYKVKKLEEGGGSEEIEELKEDVATLKSSVSAISTVTTQNTQLLNQVLDDLSMLETEVNSNTASIGSITQSLTGILNRLSTLENAILPRFINFSTNATFKVNQTNRSIDAKTITGLTPNKDYVVFPCQAGGGPVTTPANGLTIVWAEGNAVVIHSNAQGEATYIIKLLSYTDDQALDNQSKECYQSILLYENLNITT